MKVLGLVPGRWLHVPAPSTLKPRCAGYLLQCRAAARRGDGEPKPDLLSALVQACNAQPPPPAPTTSYCAEDGFGLLATEADGNRDHRSPSQHSLCQRPVPQPVDGMEIPMETSNVPSYTGGVLVLKARLSCSGCRTTLLKKATVPLADVETSIALKSYTAIMPNDAGSLLRPTEV